MRNFNLSLTGRVALERLSSWWFPSPFPPRGRRKRREGVRPVAYLLWSFKPKRDKHKRQSVVSTELTLSSWMPYIPLLPDSGLTAPAGMLPVDSGLLID